MLREGGQDKPFTTLCVFTQLKTAATSWLWVPVESNATLRSTRVRHVPTNEGADGTAKFLSSFPKRLDFCYRIIRRGPVRRRCPANVGL